MSRRARLRLDLDFFGSVVEQADADVVETEILLNLADDLAQHVDGVVAGDCSARNVVEEGQLPRTPLLLGKQARIFHGDRDLSGGGYQHVEIALFEDEFPVGMHRDHDSRRLVAQENRRSDQALGGTVRNMADAEILPRFLQIGADEQRLAVADHILGERVPQFTSALGKHAIVSDLEFEANLFAFLKGNIEVAGIENLPQFDLDGAEDLVLVEARTDRLPDLGQQFVLFRAAVGVVTDHVVFQGQSQLQSKTYHQPRARRTERSTFRVGKKNHAEIVFASLEIDRSQITDVRFGQNPLEFREGSKRSHRERLGHLCQALHRENSALPVC